MGGNGMRMRYVVQPKKPAEYISPEELQRKLDDLREARKPKRWS